jgi:hypothetical protein
MADEGSGSLFPDGVKFDLHRSAREWADLTGFSYRAILDAARSGDLESFRFTDAGPYLISDKAFEEWKESLKVRPKVKREIEQREPEPEREYQDMSQFALEQMSMRLPFRRSQ